MAHKTDRLYEKKWGVFTHFLEGCQNNPDRATNMGAGRTDWNLCVDGLDVKKIADQLAEVNAGYYFITLMQGSRFFCAPNEAFNRISGYRPGEACSRRDLIAELSAALEARGIDLYLYYTGDGPYMDSVAGPAFGFVEPRKDVSTDFLEKWAEVLREYSLRYGKKVSGWWIDGCYPFFGYDEPKLKILADAARAGNAESLVALNCGVLKRVSSYSASDDFTTGEMNDFVDIPDARFVGGEQWHTLIPLGVSPDGTEWNGWCQPGVKCPADKLRDYVSRVNEKGGVVTIDVCLYRDGTIDPDQLEALKGLSSLR